MPHPPRSHNRNSFRLREVMSSKKVLHALLLMFVSSVPLGHAADAPVQAKPIDQIMVVVNDDVITRHELDARMAVVVAQLKKQGTPLPEAAVLEKQMLERMIVDLLQVQFA